MANEILTKLSLEEWQKIKQLERERFAKIDVGRIKIPIFKSPVKIKILMLVDSGISFNQYYFGLSEVLDTLYANPEWWVDFEITKAHRFTDPNKPSPGPAFDLYGPNFENFRFTQSGFNLNDYDQLWIFGFNSSPAFPQGLDNNELEIIYKWMNDKKGGVFATGDHATLGQSLGSKIPRVRNMRKWTTADGVPSNVGANRHDTLVKGHDYSLTALDESNQYTFDDESDDIPMKTRLKWYYSPYWHLPFSPKHWYWGYHWSKYPHPVLCGKKGPINILPDHPHEGEVVVPTNLTDSPKFNTYQAEEYPVYGADRLKPEVIAWASVQDDHKVSDFKGAVNSKEFGAIGAYNGHLVNVGRVVVDSTWHHWFDVNLTGRMFFASGTPGNIETTDTRKLNGFNDTVAGKEALEKIRNYFRNVGIWLSPPDKIKSMACVALWNGLFKYPLYADLNKDMHTWLLGFHAIDVLGRFAGQCQVKSWWPVFIPRFRFEKFFNEKIALVPTLTLQTIDAFMIGGILKSLLELKEQALLGEIKEPNEKQLDSLIQKGLVIGFDDLNDFINEIDKTDEGFRGVIKEMREYIGK